MPSRAKCQESQKNKGENMTYLPFMLMIQIRYSFMTNNIKLKINITWNNYYLSFGHSLLSPKLAMAVPPHPFKPLCAGIITVQ